MQDFYAYLLRCSDGSYYAGHTDNLDERMAQHQTGAIPGYTEKRRPVTLVWSERFPDRDEAFAAERQIKGWSRAKKEALIRGDWDAVRHLAKRGPVLRDAASPSSAAPQDERGHQHTDRPQFLPAHPEEGLSHGEGPSRRTPAIVLVRPQLGENIGKAARAMLNFGLTDLRLVNPRDGWPNPSAGPAASGADAVLEQARVFDSVAEAVADCPFVYATTVRKRGLVIPVVTPEEAAREIRTNGGPSAILFGAERSGLETEEVAVAQKIVTVPINPEFRSLNLAQAVILVAYEWSKHAALMMPTEGEPAEPRATQEQLEGLIGQMDAALEAAGYYHPPDRKPATKKTMRTILTKAGWSNREIQALRGMIRALVHPRPR
ncbi:TrmJ/YjtD family RNA methyltransferase [Sphingosinicella humi]|uniref:TrmJ/YjtD family RNA methyltransferase n=1 Tax=Allosphingosinicella humi TaxID=2068657 RepID=UPI001FB17C5D|nr:TrmJ/YjtD family RNA methyltransferase [Sphingosinicella humi]